MTKISRRRFIKRTVAVCAAASMALAGLTACSGGSSTAESSAAAETTVKETAAETATDATSSSSTVADTVVYGKIYTSNANHEYAEAFAV